jgi:hypothetical protein
MSSLLLVRTGSLSSLSLSLSLSSRSQMISTPNVEVACSGRYEEFCLLGYNAV